MTSLKASIEHLHPAYFATVMATGIVSIASDLLEMNTIAFALCWLNLFFFKFCGCSPARALFGTEPDFSPI